ncbi:NADH-quinone oxidoreductase subunit L [Bythopirellula polymerisocia]|uniref:NADH-quinone oxidoreductase subunit L n=1 Tax=Bythopirellula polymerisocia TaxID=2528003 RepID=A0A5C6CS25_9BACT|nr:NADH-quinone oxidoreductase subunit L [Bythopirellula polymerisocia]TWU25876.1 NADH-quinone oxidoreductase subunit L [Bythopirellula polymerisocia]
MDPDTTLPVLLMAAWLVPLASFVLIVLFGKYMGPRGIGAGYLSVLAIVTSAIFSLIAMFGVWLPNHDFPAAHESEHSSSTHDGAVVSATDESHSKDSHSNNPHPDYYTGDWYSLGEFGTLKLTIGYYIDSLTVAMFCMVSVIASCVHIYALGYMHDELHEQFVDHEVTLSSGEHLHRKGRFYRFFQYLSLFCFSMFGIVIAGNVAMVFVFWELVGICSYFLIGFYIERHSASTAANKAFIVNRIGDFGMLIGMMALWSSVGTFAFGDMKNEKGEVEQGLFSLLRPEESEYQLAPPAGMIAEQKRMFAGDPNASAGDAATPAIDPKRNTQGQWLLFIAGVGIFCGCVGKSAQFPLHVWLPDAMEGPTPVSALVHSATMVAAGVYLVGRFYPCFSPEALLVIAYVGCITLFIAATIAITATDIKRVLAYSTVSQLGYMMLSLGLGGWVAGMFHLITHAFFKGLLFLCSGSVIHAVHTNDMTFMGGLRKKMPITAYTMLVGCLAIIGAGFPLSVYGLSGYYSKDAIIEQAWSFGSVNPQHAILKWAPVAGAFITAFYMFRLWYMTFAGQPSDPHRYDHAHESPRVMTGPLIVLAAFAIGIGWPIFHVNDLLEQGRPVGTLSATHGELLTNLTIPSEHDSHVPLIKIPAGIAAFCTALAGVLLASIIYLWRLLNPDELKESFKPLYGFLWNKWYFDELYNYLFVKPTLIVSHCAAWFDRNIIDSILHTSAAICKACSKVVDALFDQTVVDGTVNTLASGTWGLGLWLRKIQTGSLRQYVMFIVIGTVALFVTISIVQAYFIPTS